MGVEIELGRSVVEVEARAIRFADGERLEVAAVIWAARCHREGTLAHDLQASPGPGRSRGSASRRPSSPRAPTCGRR